MFINFTKYFLFFFILIFILYLQFNKTIINGKIKTRAKADADQR